MAPLVEYVKRTGSESLVLLLPGLSGSNIQWRGVVEQLCVDDVDIAYGPPILAGDGIYSLAPSVEDVAQALVDKLSKDADYRRIVVVSHSVGAFVAFEMAERSPALVSGIVAVNGALLSVARFLDRPGTEMVRRPATAGTAMRLFALSAVPTSKKFRDRIARSEFATRLLVGKLVPREVTRSADARVALSAGTSRPEVLRGLRVNRHHWRAFAAKASQIECPVTFVVGSLDPMNTPADAREMAAMLTRASVRVLDGVGHAAPLERPSEIASIIRDELAESQA